MPIRRPRLLEQACLHTTDLVQPWSLWPQLLVFLAYDSGQNLLPLFTVEEQQAGLPGFVALNGSLRLYSRVLLGLRYLYVAALSLFRLST